jgi:hypothetical protein
MAQLTDFQVETERALEQSLEKVGVALEERKLRGETETYIEAKVHDLSVWIYTDEACVKGRGVDRVFEKWDFDSPQDLRRAFIKQVLDVL